MPRHKNMAVDLPEPERGRDGTKRHSWETIHTALLMDIRDELQTLNRLLGCRNFIGIPDTLHRIQDNTYKRSYKKQNGT